MKIGDFIETCDERNRNGAFGEDAVKGISIEKIFIPTKANMDGVPLGNYKVVKPKEFAFVTVTSRNGGKISLAYNNSSENYIVSATYEVFRVNRDDVLPEYLYLWFLRPEFDRYARFHSWGSARETFSMDDMKRVEIPVPDMETQQRLVAVWAGLNGMKRDNDAQSAPLMELCMSYLKKLREEYPLRALSDNLIERVERFNSNAMLGIESVRGVSNTKEIIQTRANVSGREVKDFLVLNHHEFIFNRRTTRNGERLGLGFNESDTPILFTNDYVMFKVKDEDVLLPEFLYLCFKRDEFDRYVRWDSWGSATEFFNWENMQRVRIPIPPKAIQQAIVDIYTCAKECRDIAEQADNLRRVAGPALMQKAIHP